MQQLVNLLVINCSSTCFGRLYAHHYLATRLSNITTATRQNTIGSETQFNLLRMGVKTPKTC